MSVKRRHSYFTRNSMPESATAVISHVTTHVPGVEQPAYKRRSVSLDANHANVPRSYSSQHLFTASTRQPSSSWQHTVSATASHGSQTKQEHVQEHYMQVHPGIDGIADQAPVFHHTARFILLQLQGISLRSTLITVG